MQLWSTAKIGEQQMNNGKYWMANDELQMLSCECFYPGEYAVTTDVVTAYSPHPKKLNNNKSWVGHGRLRRRRH